MRKVLVTGATGFIGTALTQRLLTLGYKVYITSGIHPENKPLVNGRQNLNVPFQEIQWNKLPNLDAVFHLASCTDTLVRDNAYMLKVNHEDALDFIRGAADRGVRHIVYASSAAVYGKYIKNDSDDVVPFTEDMPMKPLNIYGESKARLDTDCLRLMNEYPETAIVGLRYSNVYGGALEHHKTRTASMVWQLYNKMKHESPTLFKWGNQARDFVYVDDVVTANILSSHSGHSNIYNIGAGLMWSFNQIVELVNRMLGKNHQVRYIDNPIQEFYQDYNAISIDRAKIKLGYVPMYTLKRGLDAIHRADGSTTQFQLAEGDDNEHSDYQTEVQPENA